MATFMKVLSNEIMNDDNETMIAAVQPTFTVFDFGSNRILHYKLIIYPIMELTIKIMAL